MNQTEPETVEALQAALKRFGVYDYLTFSAMLVGCALIGVYYAFASKKVKNVTAADEYLMGGRNMSTFPVAMSLAARYRKIYKTKITFKYFH